VIAPLRSVIAALLVAAAAGAQDSLQLVDGRFVMGQRMSRHAHGVTIHYPSGDVNVPRELIRECTVLELRAEEKGWSPQEQARLAKGEVLFEGKWVPAAKRDELLAARRAARAKRIEEAKAHREWVNRHKLETKNFAFEYTIDPEVMQRYAEMLEVYYATFTKEWGIAKAPKLGKLRVCFYHDAETFHEVGGAPPGVIGYFRFVLPWELNFYYERLDEELTQDVLFHEANHYLTQLIDTKFNYPSWVNESLAEYYGASEWDADAKKMVIGRLQEGRLAVIQDAIRLGEMQKLEELIRIQHGAFDAIHYAWGWSFVHYLMSDRTKADGFKKFYLALARDNGVKRVPAFRDFKQVEADEQIRLLKKHLNVKDLAELEQGWHAYVKQLKAASAGGYRNAGELALARNLPIKAQRFFKTAIEMGDKSCMTHFGYGRALYQKAKHAEAIEQFEKALAIDPLQGRFWMYLADAKERVKAPAEELARLRKLALEIEPDDYELMLRIVARGKEKVGD
jgi:tetratricopeptide (TPR) repeat protein